MQNDRDDRIWELIDEKEVIRAKALRAMRREIPFLEDALHSGKLHILSDHVSHSLDTFRKLEKGA